jgi:hypothetical protein
MRRTYATRQWKQGKPLSKIQQELGHSCVEITATCIEELEEIEETIFKEESKKQIKKRTVKTTKIEPLEKLNKIAQVSSQNGELPFESDTEQLKNSPIEEKPSLEPEDTSSLPEDTAGSPLQRKIEVLNQVSTGQFQKFVFTTVQSPTSKTRSIVIEGSAELGSTYRDTGVIIVPHKQK